MLRSAALAALLALADAAPKRNETRAEHFARRAREEKVRVIHGSGGGWSEDDDRRMMLPYWEAQNAGGTLLRISSASFMGYEDNATEQIMKKLNLEFEQVDGLRDDSCADDVQDEELVEKLRSAAGIWFGGGLPGRVVSCLYGHTAEAFGINTAPEDTTPVLEALWAHPLVGGISAGAMMQPSAALYNGNEISYRPSLANSGSAIRIGEALMNNRGAGFVQDQFTIHSHFSERGYQGMMPVALVQRVADNLNWAAGFDEGGVGHYYESTGEVFTRGVPDRGTGIALFSDCLGDEHAQQCLTHFVSDGDVWNSRTGEFDMAEGKQLCTGTQTVPEARCALSAPLV